MVVVNYSKNLKHCCNCEYWVGERSLSPNQKYVIADPETHGKCYGTKFKGAAKKAAETHSCWQKWLLLNESCLNDDFIKELDTLLQK